MDKKKKLLSKKLAKIRGWIQAAATLLTNIHIPNLFKGKIYQGNAKTVCVPGLNCYSCPAATGACPIGAFQAVVGSSKFKFSYYITGFFILLGVTLGRFICRFLCPFGWFQDLLHKIPGKKDGVKYRNLSIDSSSAAGKYASEIMAFPTTILVDRNGNIVGEPMLSGIDNKDNYDALMKQIQSVIDADSTNK